MHYQVFKRKINKKEGNINFVSYLDATGETIETLPPSSISPPVAGKIFGQKFLSTQDTAKEKLQIIK